MTHPVRSSILFEGIKLTCGDRNEAYGDPKANMACAGELKAVLRKYAARDISPEEWEAIDMTMTKMSRVVTGPKPKRDNYTDGSVYFAIAGEMALRADMGLDEPPAISPPSE